MFYNAKRILVLLAIITNFCVCGYVLDAKSGSMISYKCKEPNLQNEDGTNMASLDSFITIPNGEKSKAKVVKINILVPLSDKPDARNGKR
jgi:hypothetical protein